LSWRDAQNHFGFAGDVGVLLGTTNATPDTTVTASGPTWLWRWATTRKVRLDAKEDPEVPAWVMAAYRR